MAGDRSSGRALVLVLALLTSCGGGTPDRRAVTHGTGNASPSLNRVAESYVRLVLALGIHDANYVDAYYGPPEWKKEADSQRIPLMEIRTRATSLLGDLGEGAPPGTDEMTRLRHGYLLRQLRALVARVEMLGGRKLTFDEESRALYDAVAPSHGEDHFRKVLDRLERALPGPGPLFRRYEVFRKDFVIPPERLDTVFQAAISACRERTARHIQLPPGESFQVEYVTGKSWSAYNWYQGGLRSLIQVNTSLPTHIDRAVDLACHEGYPGHHVYNVLLEQNLVRGRGWVEFAIYPLFSPQSLIAEGSANHGVRMAFPGEERVLFERETLFPVAGLDPNRAGEYDAVRTLVRELSYAGNEAARRYLDGEIDARTARDWLTRYSLMSVPAAEQRLRFIDDYRSYVINYNLGEDLVRGYVERKAGAGASSEKAWRVFEELLATPRLPSDLR